MAELDKEQLDFLSNHGIDVRECFDAQGSKPRIYGRILRDYGLKIAYGVTECKLGHSLRNYQGTCIMCQPEKLAYINRYRESKYIYIAYSRKSELLKIGTTRKIEGKDNRAVTLNKQRYGGCNDWEIFESAYVSQSGLVEQLIQDKLKSFLVEDLMYWKNDKYQKANEIFDCRLAIALEVFEESIEDYLEDDSEVS